MTDRPLSPPQHLEKMNAVMDRLQALIGQQDAKAEAVVYALKSLAEDVQAFVTTTDPREVEADALIALRARLDTLFNQAQKAEGETRERLKDIARRLQAQKSYGQGSRKK